MPLKKKPLLQKQDISELLVLKFFLNFFSIFFYLCDYYACSFKPRKPLMKELGRGEMTGGLSGKFFVLIFYAIVCFDDLLLLKVVNIASKLLQ